MKINKVSLRRRQALSPTVIRLGLISFFADFSSEMLYPITPIFLTSVLGVSMLSVGIIEGIAEALAAILKTYAGAWSDKLRLRRPFIICGYCLAAVAKPLVGIAHSWVTVLLARAIDRTGKGIRSAPRDALLSDSVNPKLQGEAFGWHRLMDTLGATVGPLCTILFLKINAAEIRTLYFWAVVPGLVAVLATFSIRESSRSDIGIQAKTLVTPSWGNTSRDFKTYLSSWALFSIGNSSDAFLILKAKQQGNSLIATVFMYCVFNLIYALLSPGLGRLSDAFPRRIVLASGLLIFGLVYLGFSFATAPWHFWLLFGVYGIYMASTDGVGKAVIVDLIPKNLLASGLGLFGTVSGIATIVASVMGGTLWDHCGSAYTFYYGASTAVLSAICLLLFVPRSPAGSSTTN